VRSKCLGSSRLRVGAATRAWFEALSLYIYACTLSLASACAEAATMTTPPCCCYPITLFLLSSFVLSTNRNPSLFLHKISTLATAVSRPLLAEPGEKEGRVRRDGIGLQQRKNGRAGGSLELVEVV
jgi:hypothetical protein